MLYFVSTSLFSRAERLPNYTITEVVRKSDRRSLLNGGDK